MTFKFDNMGNSNKDIDWGQFIDLEYEDSITNFEYNFENRENKIENSRYEFLTKKCNKSENLYDYLIGGCLVAFFVFIL